MNKHTVIKVEADISSPRTCVLTVEAVVKEICLKTKRDPAEGVMMLLTGAAHIYRDYAKNPNNATILIESLLQANEAAKGFFGSNDK